jgi:TetR/AcrR family transcriptional regulator, transcriptional repressor for nem operon
MAKGKTTRERIVTEAANLFNQRGFEGCSMSDLMAATGLEKGGIYRHFSSKEELAAEAFVAIFIERRTPVPGGCPILNTAIEADDGNALLRDRARSALREWGDYLAEIVRAGIKRKEIRKDIDPNEVATVVISLLEGALMIARLERDKQALLSARTRLERYLETEVRLNSRSL